MVRVARTSRHYPGALARGTLIAGMKTYIFEPQLIFVPKLVETIKRAGLSVIRVRDMIDPLDIVRIRPDVLFIDDECTLSDLSQTIGFLQAALPSLHICVYGLQSSSRGWDASQFSQVAFVSKSLDSDQLALHLSQLTQLWSASSS
jgi:hypothetical protein